jgi:V/A-type H+-transporting ATPase subunit A
VLTVAEMIKNGFLQQSAFDEVDVYSVPEKQLMILQLIMNFYRRALAVIKMGAPLLKINELSVRDEIIRIKTSVPNDKLDMIHATIAHLDEQMGELERIYRKAEIA